jgi:hypothetical protein
MGFTSGLRGLTGNRKLAAYFGYTVSQMGVQPTKAYFRKTLRVATCRDEQTN